MPNFRFIFWSAHTYSDAPTAADGLYTTKWVSVFQAGLSNDAALKVAGELANQLFKSLVSQSMKHAIACAHTALTQVVPPTRRRSQHVHSIQSNLQQNL